MAIPASAASAAYLNAAKSALPAAEKTGAAASVEQDFSALLKSAVEAVEQSGARTDAISAASTVGKADMVDVVTAVAETELTVRTLVSVRDRVISAYQEIMRMPI